VRHLERRAREQQPRRDEASAQSHKPNEWQENVERDQVEYIPGTRGQRRTIQLSPEKAAPKQLPLETVDSRLAAINTRLAEIELATKPAPRPAAEPTWADIFKALRRKIWNRVTK
jgi:hypothetical protein